MATKKEPIISEQEVQEIVERMGRRESRDRTSLNDFYKSVGLEPDVPGQTKAPDTSETEAAVTKDAANEVLEESTSDMNGKAAVPQKRISSKQRRLSLDEYRTSYLQVPKIINRKPVFVSETVRDELDRVVRYLGGKGMSASGLVENLVRLHLESFRDDIEQWRKL